MFRPLLFCSIICLHRINLRNSEKYWEQGAEENIWT
jgi:hypothetical protein